MGAALGLALSEALVRVVFTIDTEYDPVLGRVMAAGATTRWGGEGFGTARWTIHGLRRASPPDRAKPSILVLGDSYVEAKNVDDSEVLTHVLEEKLRGGKTPFQVLNAGRSYASAADYVSLAPFYRSELAPRWTIIQLREPDITTDAFDRKKGYMARFAIDQSGGKAALRVVPGEPSRPSRFWGATRLIRRSSLITYGMQRLTEFEAAARAEPPLFFAADAPPPRPEGQDDAAERYPIADILKALHKAYDGRVTLLYLPNFDPQKPSEVDRSAERAFDAACAGASIRCINFRSEHASFAARRTSPYGFVNTRFNFGHMNAEGHRAVAEVLAREMERLAADDLL